jgi:MoaA/NifB/PqqE/SkfB family radical SAM enzyme
VTISTTFRCNSRCLTCNVYERPVDELTVDEWDKVFVALGRAPQWFTFSGGEPFCARTCRTSSKPPGGGAGRAW